MESIIRNSTVKATVNNDLIVAKAVAMGVLGVTSFVIGILPMKLTKLTTMKSVNGDKNLIISLFLCFGGGVLLFTTFIHLQPEVREIFNNLEQKNALPEFSKKIPLSELVFCLGFFFVYLVEELVHLFLDRKLPNTALHRSLSVRRCSQKEVSIPRVTLSKTDDGNISYITTSNKELLNSTVPTESHPHHHHSHVVRENIKNSLSGFLAVVALSFHAVFEGLAVGLEAHVEKVWYLFAAIATHKFVIAFCVGIELTTSRTKAVLIVLYIGTFAVVTPLGIGVGIILSEKDRNGEDLFSVILQAMAAGTLLYVVFFEVLAREKGNEHKGIWQLFAIFGGFVCMFSLQILIGHQHNHNGDVIRYKHNHSPTF